ncbi:hypothetical protein ACVIW0_002276 [Bradyrhizobium sp. USDA 4454]
MTLLPIKAWRMAAVLCRHSAYYGIAGNGTCLGRFRFQVMGAWRRVVLRRSQRPKLSWERFNAILKVDRACMRLASLNGLINLLVRGAGCGKAARPDRSQLVLGSSPGAPTKLSKLRFVLVSATPTSSRVCSDTQLLASHNIPEPAARLLRGVSPVLPRSPFGTGLTFAQADPQSRKSAPRGSSDARCHPSAGRPAASAVDRGKRPL